MVEKEATERHEEIRERDSRWKAAELETGVSGRWRVSRSLRSCLAEWAAERTVMNGWEEQSCGGMNE